MYHCIWNFTESTESQVPPPPPAAPPPPVEPPPPSSSLLHAAATNDNASTPAARNLCRFPLMWAPSPRGHRPEEACADATSCPIERAGADASRREQSFECDGGEVEREAQQAGRQDVGPRFRVVRQRDVARDPAPQAVLRAPEVLGDERRDHRSRSGDLERREQVRDGVGHTYLPKHRR